jgi:TolA-binding protein
MFQLGLLEIEQGNYQQSIEGLSQLIREAPGSKFIPFAYTRRANSYYNLQQYDKAINDYATVITQFPTHPEAEAALLPMQEAMTAGGKSGDFDKYLANFKKANPTNTSLEAVEFEAAKSPYFSQQYQKAISSLNGFVSSYPQSSAIPEARYYIAESHFRLNELDKALGVYNELGRDVNFEYYSRVVARIPEVQFRLGRYNEAVTGFHNLEKIASTKKEQHAALSGLMESFYLLNKYDSADIYARQILERGNVNPGALNKASLYLGKTAFARGDLETAKDELLNTLNAAQDEYGAEAKYLLAQISFQNKEYKQTYETLTALNNDFSAYDEWVGKSYLLLADNFQAQDNIFQAKLTLQSLIDGFPLQHIKDEARRKLKDIEQVEADKKKKIEADTLDK